MSMSVCVRGFARLSLRSLRNYIDARSSPIFACRLWHIVVSWSSFSGVAIRFLLPVLRMTSYLDARRYCRAQFNVFVVSCCCVVAHRRVKSAGSGACNPTHHCFDKILIMLLLSYNPIYCGISLFLLGIDVLPPNRPTGIYFRRWPLLAVCSPTRPSVYLSVPSIDRSICRCQRAAAATFRGRGRGLT